MKGIGNVRPVDSVLTEYGLEFRQNQTNFVAGGVAPWVQTDGDTGTYYIADALNMLGVDNVTWSYTEGAPRGDSAFGSSSFKALPYGREEAVPDAYVRNWLAGGQDLKQRVTTSLQQKMLLAREVRAYTLATSLAPVNISSTACWDSTAPNPRADVQATAGQAIMKRTGMMPNTVVMAPTVWYAVIGDQSAGTAGALILDAIKYTRPGLGNVITPDLVAQYLNVSYCLPALAVRNAAADVETTTVNTGGLAVAGTSIWADDEVYVFYCDRNPGPQTLSWMTTFGPDMGAMDQYRDDRVKADIVRVTETLVEKITCATAAYVIGTVTTG